MNQENSNQNVNDNLVTYTAVGLAKYGQLIANK